ncbi:MAG: MFS transporter [Planctomycetaceae bacterium]
MSSSSANPKPQQPPTVYDGVYWLTYFANLLLVTASALTFRFAELVAFLGGSEHQAGSIVSLGIGCALGVRIVLGQAIDHHGPRRYWLLAAVLFVVSCSLLAFCHALSWQIYVARMLFATSVSTMFTCSVVHVQKRVPTERRAEIIGNLGSSGFLGMIIGSLLGDEILRLFSDDPSQQFFVLFGAAAGLGCLYLLTVILLTRSDQHFRPPETVGVHRLMWRYWPGNIALVGLMMGVALTVTTVFLTRYATSRHLEGLGTFFTTYAISAFVMRLKVRRWTTTIGRHRMVVLGLAGHALGHFILPFVTRELQFVVPALCCGFGHALLFPAVVSKGSGAFPTVYRGSGTTVILGTIDLGAALSAPILGWIIDLRGFHWMFNCSAGFALFVATVYACTSAQKPDHDYFETESVKPTTHRSDSNRRPVMHPLPMPPTHAP